MWKQQGTAQPKRRTKKQGCKLLVELSFSRIRFQEGNWWLPLKLTTGWGSAERERLRTQWQFVNFVRKTLVAKVWLHWIQSNSGWPLCPGLYAAVKIAKTCQVSKKQWKRRLGGCQRETTNFKKAAKSAKIWKIRQVGQKQCKRRLGGPQREMWIL